MPVGARRESRSPERVSPGDQPLAEELEDSGYEIETIEEKVQFGE